VRLLLYCTQTQDWPTISIIVVVILFEPVISLHRDYTRPDLPSGPNENPFGGADIASLAALGEMHIPFS